MNRTLPTQMLVSAFALAGVLTLAGAPPAAADQVLTLASHTDEMKMMGKTTPAKDETHTYWFGADGTRYDMGEMSVITRLDLKKLYFVNHGSKTYSAIDLPFDFKSLVGPEMAPMMDMMAKQMAATVTVTPTDKTGNFAGIACTYSKVDIKMAMMSMSTDSCMAETMPIDLSRYQELTKSYAELFPNMDWVKQMAEKLKGFPIRSDTTMNIMGSASGNWQELKTIEEKSAPAGTYDPPADYKEQKYDPMAQMQQGRR
jgi:hypothetical protein